MSDDILDPVAQANALVATYNSDGDVTSLMTGFNTILGTPKITTSEAIAVVIIFNSIITTITSLSFVSTFDDLRTTTTWSTDVASKCLRALKAIFTNNTALSSTSISNATSKINGITSQSSFTDTTFSDLWTNIISGDNQLTAAETTSITNLWTATIQMYTNLNISNYLSVMCTKDVLVNSLSPIIQVVSQLSSPSSSSTNAVFQSSLYISLANILLGNASNISNGMSRIEFISACRDLLAIFSPYLTTDQMTLILPQLKTSIASNFKASTTYSTELHLSGAKTFTYTNCDPTTPSPYCYNFGVGAIPITPLKAVKFILDIPTIYASYTFGPTVLEAIEVDINNYFNNSTYVNIEAGLYPADINAFWKYFKPIIVGELNDGELDVQYEATFTTEFTNLVTKYLILSISDVLSASAFYDSASASVIQVVDPSTITATSTGSDIIAGVYLSDWQDTFITKITSTIGGSIPANVLRMGISDMMESANDKTALGYYCVTGNSFIQIGIEILLFLNTLDLSTYPLGFLQQVATDFTAYLITILNVETLIAGTNEVVAAANAGLIAAAIVLAFFSLGFSLLAFTGLSYGAYAMVKGVAVPDTTVIAALVGDENVPVYIGVVNFLITAGLLTT